MYTRSYGFPILSATLLIASGSVTSPRADNLDGERLPFVQVGDPAPAFSCLDDQGKEWRSATNYGKKKILLCFYLGDFFKPCTEEMRVLRDARNMLATEDIEVVAVSGDTVETHALFKKTHRLNFSLLADEKGAVGKAFGVAMSGGGQQRIAHPETKEEIILKRGSTAARWTWLIGKNGRILHKDTNVNVEHQPRRILEALATLKK